MDDVALLLQAVLDNPDEDTPRLIYADAVEERGQRERAEFIRVQCEIARRGLVYCQRRTPRGSHAFRTLFWHQFTKGCRCEGCKLRRREYMVSRRFVVWDWREGIPAVSNITYERGFVSRVGLPTPDFIEHAGAIFARHPVTAVRLTDKAPERIRSVANGQYWWYDDQEMTTPDDPDVIPSSLWLAIPGTESDSCENFDTLELAHQWLSARCVAYGHQQAIALRSRPCAAST